MSARYDYETTFPDTSGMRGEAPTDRQLFELVTDRLRAAILDVIEESGVGSPEHLRLRYALSGEGESPLSPESVRTVQAERERFDRERS